MTAENHPRVLNFWTRVQIFRQATVRAICKQGEIVFFS